jgi:class 3 adenylate cyclase
MFAITVPVVLLSYLSWSFLITTFEKSDRYIEAAVVSVIAVPVLVYVVILPRLGRSPVELWAAGCEIDPAAALEDTYIMARRGVLRAVVFSAVWGAILSIVVAAYAGANGSRLVQYGVLGACVATALELTGVHSIAEAGMRPARAALAGNTGIGDSLPRSRPTFAAWSSVLMLSVVFADIVAGVMLAAVFDRFSEEPLFALVIAGALTAFAVLFVGLILSPTFQPIRDIAKGTDRVAAGDYSQRLPVVQDDDLGALAASFNRMQAGLAERQRLQAAFGTYVDPALAAKLLEQGDDVFTGERREVTVMFVDIRDFTPFAEANTAEDTVARLNALFEIVVPAVVDAGGHVNKFLGDGALAVFGAPNDLVDHAAAALSVAVLIHRLVAEHFGRALRIGIGINTGTVIAGTIGGGSKLEFTLIGDTVNVAARVEQLTKSTGDAILMTEQSVDALTSRPPGLVDRGLHTLKGKSAEVQVYGIDPTSRVSK